MYSLDCRYYTKSFNTLDELIDDILTSGMDPNYNIVVNGVVQDDLAIDYMPI